MVQVPVPVEPVPADQVPADQVPFDQAPVKRGLVGPLVLYTNDARRGRLVAAANATARQRGVVPGMTLAQLTAICPEAKWSEHDPSADVEELLTIAEGLQQFCPLVGLETLGRQLWAGRSIHQSQGIFLDITGLAAWYGSEMRLGVAIQRWLAGERLLCTIGIAGSVGAAWAIANYRCRHQITDAMLRLESGEEFPADGDWVFEVAPGADMPESLGRYPIESLRLELDVVAKLHRLGIKTVSALLQLPRASLTSRFGPELLERIDQTIHGRDELIRSCSVGTPMEIDIELEHVVFDLVSLEGILRQASIELCKRLDQVGHGAFRIVCRIALERQSIAVDASDPQPSGMPLAHVIQLSLFQGSRDPEHWVWLLLGHLANNPLNLAPFNLARRAAASRMRGHGEFGIRAVRIEATATAPLHWHQNQLFDGATNRYRDDAARLIDSLSSRLGRNRVLTPSIQRDPIPENQVRMRPLTGLRKDGESQRTKNKMGRKQGSKLGKDPKRDFSDEHSLESRPEEYLSRPTRLMSEPEPVEVVQLENGELASITHRREKFEVSAFAGPERIESGWWDGPTERRDYFRVVLSTGDWWWIYRDLQRKQWFLHGCFD